MVYDEKVHLDKFKESCNKEFYDLVDDLPSKFKNMLANYSNLFYDKVNKVIEERGKALDNEQQKKEKGYI